MAFVCAAAACDPPDLGPAVDVFIPDPDGECRGGPDRSVVLCEPSPGRAVPLVRAQPSGTARFVVLPGLVAPTLDEPDQIPTEVGTVSIDEFLAAHPDGLLGARFADLDLDGDLDVVSAAAGSVRVWRNEGDGAFADWQTLPVPTWARVRTCDLDVDGDADIVSIAQHTAEAALGLLVNDGRGELRDEAASRAPELSDAGDAACVDIDGDGAPELVVATSSGPDRLLLNDGSGAFHEAPPLPPDGDTTSRFVLAGDVDGDGRADAILGGDGSARLVLDLGGTPTTTPLPMTSTSSGALGDVDGDGDLDLVLRGSSVSLWLNDGAGGFVDATDRIAVARSPYYGGLEVTLGDFDADGDLDIEAEQFWPPVQINTRLHPVADDTEPPSVEILEPVDGAVAREPPLVRARFSDAVTGIDPTSVRLSLAGEDVGAAFVVTHDAAFSRLGAIAFEEGENVLTLEARDMAGNGLRRVVTFSLDPAALPFAARLMARDAAGHLRSSFEPGEPVELVVRVANASATSLHVPASCGGPHVRIFDAWGSMVWLPLDVCLDLGHPSGGVPPCSVRELVRAWNQTHWLTGEPVSDGRYTVQACLAGVSGLASPPEIEITIR